MAEEFSKETTDKKRWSYSRLSCFEHCKYAFYLKYIVNDDRQYLPEGNFYAESGSFVHEILAMIFSKELSIEDAPQYYVDNFENNVCYTVKKSIMEKTYEACANYFAEVDLDDWLNNYEIIGVELEVKTKICGYNYIGYIDLLLRNKKTGDIWLIDHKSSPYPFKLDGTVAAKSKNNFESYKRQMYLYCYAVKELFGEYPTLITWNHFKDGKLATIEFDKEDYDNSIGWFVETIDKIKKEKKFDPNQEFFYCSNLCDYRNSCEYKNMGGK